MKSFSVVAIIDDGPFKCHICQVSSSVLSESRWFSKSSSFLWSPQRNKQLCRSVLRWSMLAPSAAHGATGCFQFRSLIPDPVLRSCLLQCCFPSAKIFTSRSWSGPKIRRNPVTLGDGRPSKCRQLLHFYTCGYESKPWPLGTLK